MNGIVFIALLAIATVSLAADDTIEPFAVSSCDLPESKVIWHMLMILDGQERETEGAAEAELENAGLTWDGARALVQHARKSQKESIERGRAATQAVCADKESLRYAAFPLAERLEAMRSDEERFQEAKAEAVASILSAADFAAFRKWKDRFHGCSTDINPSELIRAGRLPSDDVINRMCGGSGT
jgi:hypothetical protein